MAKIPKTLEILGHTVEVRLVKTTQYQGECDYKNNEIRIANSYKASNQASTLLHEVLHMIFGKTELFKIVPSTLEETVVSNLETGLFQIIRDNPKFVEYIMEAK